MISKPLPFLLALLACPALGTSAGAQVQVASASDLSDVPDAPQAQKAEVNQNPQPTSATQQPKQTKRILGIVPNFRAVSTDAKLPPETAKEKFTTAFQDSFDYSSFIFVGVQAGIAQASNSYPEFRQGAAGFGRYYWHTFADTADENIWVEGIFPTVLHQDNRYYTLGRGGLLKRTAYSFTRTLVTRADSGKEVPNFSEVVGAGTSSAISAAYYPTRYQTWTKVGQRWLTSVLIDGGTFVAKEFWPDINSHVFHQKQ